MKILVVRIGRAGDMVMITPALTALINKYPAAEITLLTSTDGRRVLNDFHPQIKTSGYLIAKNFSLYPAQEDQTRYPTNGLSTYFLF